MGGVQKDGLTLEGLAQRLEALTEKLGGLEQENAELRDEVGALRGSGTLLDEVSALKGSDTHRGREPASLESEGPVSRRALLSKAGAAAVAAMAAGTLLYPREANATHTGNNISADRIVCDVLLSNRASGLSNDGTEGVWGETTSAGTGGVLGLNRGSGPGVKGRSETAAVQGIATGISGVGVEGKTEGSNGTGVTGTGRYGVWGESDQAGFYGVTGRNTRTDGTGVRGVGAKRGVLGESTNSTGVEGRGKNGVLGESSTEGQNGVWGKHTNQGAGVSGVGRVGVLGFSHENGWNAVWGRHTTNGRGVAGDSAQGVGVSGESTGGIGGEFKGGKAQLRLVPGGVAGKPASGTHTKGEIYMDSRGTLFVCTAGDGTTVGTWKKVNMKLV